MRQLAAGSSLDPAELYRLTGGNPFFVTELVAAGIPEVPAAARDAVLARAARLSPQARKLLDVAALIGTRIEPQLIEATSADSAAPMDEILASGLIVEDGPRLKFRHEIARLAAEQAIRAHRRGAIHTRILAALRTLGCEDDARMAFHAEGASDGEAVLRYATSAARRAAALASHREAAAQFERALRFAAGTNPATAAALCDGLAYEASLIDRWQDAADAREHALELWRQAGDPLREGDTMRRLSRTMWRLCRGADALAAAESALATLEPLGPSPELAWAVANLATPADAGRRAQRSDRAGQDGLSPWRGRWVCPRCSATRSTLRAVRFSRKTRARPEAASWPRRCRSRSPQATRSRQAGRTGTCTPATAASAGSPKPTGGSPRESPIAMSTTSPRTAPACGASVPALWRRPDGGMSPRR